jgi:hypothetical protein
VFLSWLPSGLLLGAPLLGGGRRRPGLVRRGVTRERHLSVGWAGGRSLFHSAACPGGTGTSVAKLASSRGGQAGDSAGSSCRRSLQYGLQDGPRDPAFSLTAGPTTRRSKRPGLLGPAVPVDSDHRRDGFYFRGEFPFRPRRRIPRRRRPSPCRPAQWTWISLPHFEPHRVRLDLSLNIVPRIFASPCETSGSWAGWEPAWRRRHHGPAADAGGASASSAPFAAGQVGAFPDGGAGESSTRVRPA